MNELAEEMTKIASQIEENDSLRSLLGNNVKKSDDKIEKMNNHLLTHIDAVFPPEKMTDLVKKAAEAAGVEFSQDEKIRPGALDQVVDAVNVAMIDAVKPALMNAKEKGWLIV
jgi:hypothetical protein